MKPAGLVVAAIACLALVLVLVGTSASSAAVDLRAPTSLSVKRSGDTLTLGWRNRARDGRIVEIRTSASRTVRRVTATRRRVTLAAPKAGRRLTIRLRACTRRGGACGPSVRIVAVGPPTTTTTAPTPAGTVPTVGGCPGRPATDPWNTDISQAPVDPRSAAYIASIGGADTLHADFGSGQYGDYGIPITVVPQGQPLVPIRFTAYGDESDPGPYPVPPAARVEGGNDRHVIVVRQGDCRLYELYHAAKASTGAGWSADSAAIFDLRSSALRPAGWTSADAAGLPILPGLARADEASAGAIRHALRFTVARSQRAYVPPARHAASDSTDPDLPPMGLRLRLKASYDVSPVTGQARAILDALKTYGMIVADNGSDWFISGTPDPRWDDEDLDQLKRVPGSAFEVVQVRGLQRP
jgi:hypothetical protein